MTMVASSILHERRTRARMASRGSPVLSAVAFFVLGVLIGVQFHCAGLGEMSMMDMKSLNDQLPPSALSKNYNLASKRIVKSPSSEAVVTTTTTTTPATTTTMTTTTTTSATNTTTTTKTTPATKGASATQAANVSIPETAVSDPAARQQSSSVEEAAAAAAAMTAKSPPNTTLKYILNHQSKAGCSPDYKHDPVTTQDQVNDLIGHYLLREPTVPLNHFTPPELEPDCRDFAVFTGNQTNQTVLYSAFMFSHELDLLEARLMEGIGIVDKIFLAESMYTHRGHLKAKFAKAALQEPHGRLYKVLRKANISNPSDYVHVLDLDQYCPKYVETVKGYRNRGQGTQKPNEIWDTQATAQSCLATAVRHYAMQNSPDALAQISDLDEMLWRQTLVNIKHCEFDPSRVINWGKRNEQESFHIKWHMPAPTTLSIMGKFCSHLSREPVGRILIPAIEMDHARNVLDILQYAPLNPNQPIRRNQTVPRGSGIAGGIHMTYMGGALLNIFKVSNHAEGGQMEQLGFLNETYSPSICTATKEDWYRMEELVCYDTETVLKPGGVKVSPEFRKKKEDYVSFTNHEPHHLPWVMVQNKARYPCFFADTKACVDTYIDYVTH